MALAQYSGVAPIPGTTLSVFLVNTTTLATLYADLAGTVPQANPFVSDPDTGVYSYVADDQDGYLVVLAMPAVAPSTRTAGVPEVRFNGTTPNRTASLVVTDAVAGVEVVLAQQRY